MSNRSSYQLSLWLLMYLAFASVASAQNLLITARALFTGDFHWTASAPLISPAERKEDPCISVKDPSIVYFEGKWHLFSTIRSKVRSHQIEYSSFSDWSQANTAPRHILTITNGYFCAPQVFYFTPQKRWYLVYQALDTTRKPALQPAFSTSTDISDPASWSAPQFFYDKNPDNITSWIDFWVICAETKAHLFFTNNKGVMWRAETSLADFPKGWSKPVVAIKDDIFEASHTYHLKGMNQYLTIVEAQGEAGRRYYKAYLANKLDGVWRPLATTREKTFASFHNVKFKGEKWSDSISHGELLRLGYDEKMTVNPGNLKFLFQGVSDADRTGKKYGEIPWRLGLLQIEPQ